MILGRGLLTALGLDLRFSENVIIGREKPYEGWSAPMVDISNNKFKYITDKNNKPEESFVNLYVNKCFESNNAKSPTRRMRKLLDAKYEKADLNKFIEEHNRW